MRNVALPLLVKCLFKRPILNTTFQLFGQQTAVTVACGWFSDVCSFALPMFQRPKRITWWIKWSVGIGCNEIFMILQVLLLVSAACLAQQVPPAAWYLAAASWPAFWSGDLLYPKKAPSTGLMINDARGSITGHLSKDFYPQVQDSCGSIPNTFPESLGAILNEYTQRFSFPPGRCKPGTYRNRWRAIVKACWRI